MIARSNFEAYKKETGVAFLIAPPVTRRPDTRAVLADVDMRSAIGHVKLLLLEM